MLRPRRRACSVPAALAVACVLYANLLFRRVSGLAAHFDGVEVRVVSHRSTEWTGFSSSEGTTLETWVKFTDRNLRWSPLLHYVTLSPTSGIGEAEELTFVVGGFGSETALGWRRAGTEAYCRACGSMWTDGYWHHLVATLSYATGDMAYYVNGTLMYDLPGANVSDAFRSVPRPGGELLLGVGIETAGDGTVVSQLASMLVDDLRIHNRPLTATEVALGAWQSPRNLSYVPGSLVLHWAFDNPVGAVEYDMSGHGAHGRRGALDNRYHPHVFYRSQATKQAAMPPSFCNGALLPPNGSYPNSIVTLFSPTPGRSVEVADLGDTAIVAPPVVELLSSASGSADEVVDVYVDHANSSHSIVFYRAPPGSSPPSDAAVEFSYRVGDGVGVSSGMARIYPAPGCAARDRVVSAQVGKPLTLTLGGVCPDGRPVIAEALSPPSAGRLYAFKHGYQVWPYFFDLSDASIGDAFHSFPAALDNREGVAVFGMSSNPMSASRQDQTFNVTMQYRWLSAVDGVNNDGGSSPGDDVALLTIVVRLVHRPPELSTTDFETLGDGSIRVLLNSSYGSNIADHSSLNVARYRVIRDTMFGLLYQDVGDAERAVRGSRIVGLGNSRGVLRQFPDRIPPYSSATGPAFSSQSAVQCYDCCKIQATCTLKNCADAGYADPEFCVTTKHGSQAMLGAPPTDWSSHGRDEQMRPFYWTPDCPNCGQEFIVLGFLEPVYVTAIEVYELLSPGSVVSLSVASDYEGNRTDWHNLWSGVPEPAGTSTPRVFSPNICPDTTVRAQWLRIDLLTNLTSQANMFVGAAMYGNAADASDWVYSDGVIGRLMYVPTPGVAVRDGVDTFDVVTSDCSTGESDVASVAVPSFDSTALSTAHFGDRMTLDTTPDGTLDVNVSLRDAAAHLSRAFGLGVDEVVDFEVELQPSACFDVVISRDNGDDNVVIATANSGVVSDIAARQRNDDRSPCAAIENDVKMALPNNEPSFSARPGNRGVRYGSFALFVTSRNVTYRLLVEVGVVCPPGAHPTECATGPDACEESGLRFDPLEGLCTELFAGAKDDGIASSTIAALISVGVVILLLVLVASFLLFQYKGLKGFAQFIKRGPPHEGEFLTMVITDIQGSTTLWDHFTDQVANDIAVHHDCMRKQLAKCHGYEVATEGDSFKCAFRTPEDAILWCILVQLNLLRAPWSAELEDGGASVLSGNPDWASPERPQIAEHSLRFLDTLVKPGHAVVEDDTASDKGSRRWQPLMSLRQSALSNRVAASPLQPRSSRATVSSEGELETEGDSHKRNVLHKPTGSLLPLFRGLRVRMGVHTGLAEEVKIHDNTRRLTYGGKVVEIAKAVSDLPCGGQIMITGDTMAHINSMTDLTSRVAQACADWQMVADGRGGAGSSGAAGMSILHLGSHLLSPPPAPPPTPPAPCVASPVRPVRSRKFSRLDTTSWREPVRFADLVEERPDDKAGEAEGPSSERWDALQGEHAKLRVARELLVVVPWPLRSRVICYPPVASHAELTPAWHSAPRGHLTIVFTFLAEWAKLKDYLHQHYSETAPELLATALGQCNLVVRGLLIQHGGYEMEGEDGNFVCVFQRSLDALSFANQLQLVLVEVPWSAELLSSPMACPHYSAGAHLVFRGLRVKVGMCSGTPSRVHISPRTGRMEYFGPMLNHAARVASVAHGGQVLLHESTLESLADSFSDELSRADDLLFAPQGYHMLKGISKPVRIVQAIAKPLQTRQFPEIKTQGLSAGKHSKAPSKSVLSFRSTLTYPTGLPPEVEEMAARERAYHMESNESIQSVKGTSADGDGGGDRQDSGPPRWSTKDHDLEAGGEPLVSG